MTIGAGCVIVRASAGRRASLCPPLIKSARRFKRLKLKRKRGTPKTKKSIFDLYNEQNPPRETSTDTKTVARVEDETKTVTKEEPKEEPKTEPKEEPKEETKAEETKTEEIKGGDENVL